MGPYRTSALVPHEPVPQRSRIARMWTRFKRKALLAFGGGPYKQRYPDRCDVCGRRAKDTRGPGDTIYIPNTYEPCGHTYTFWRRLQDYALKKRQEKARQENLAKHRPRAPIAPPDPIDVLE